MEGIPIIRFFLAADRSFIVEIESAKVIKYNVERQFKSPFGASGTSLPPFWPASCQASSGPACRQKSSEYQKASSMQQTGRAKPKDHAR